MNKIILGIVIFLLIGALMIKCSLDTDFSEEGDRKTFISAFKGWIKQLGSSTKDTAKYAVKKKEWLPTDEVIDEAKEDSDENQTEKEEAKDKLQEDLDKPPTELDNE